MTDAPAQPTYAVDDGIALLTMDDGKVNVISHGVLDALDDALDRAEGDGARALVIAGRPGGAFCAGFDLPTMTASTESMRGLVLRGAETMMRLYGYRLPTVAACTGHALAAGALLLLSIDHRVGAEGKAKIGLNEVQIGMGLPIFAVELARERLATAELAPATTQARIYDPAGAASAGYLDRVVPAESILDEAVADAHRLAELRTGAYARTKAVLREAVIGHILDTLQADIDTLTGPES
jgi:enoyl-CoA hydratase/carnithine racemase